MPAPDYACAPSGLHSFQHAPGGQPMKISNTAAAAAAIAVMVTGAHAADIKVICSNGFGAVMHELGPQFERATGHKLVVSYGLAAVLLKEIEGGETFDLTILAPPQIDAL